MRQGRILAIHVHERSGEMPHSVPEARLIAGKGIPGDAKHAAAERNPGPERADQALTLIESEALEAAARDYGIHLSGAESRRNVLTQGVALNHLVGREFRVGSAVCFGVELCEPCGHLEKMTGKGVVKALLHRGGLRARILRDGVARPGDPVEPGPVRA
jgi:MOSC domain-containing protein YiiM